MISSAWANHGDFGLYAMSWGDALIFSVLGIVIGCALAVWWYTRDRK